MAVNLTVEPADTSQTLPTLRLRPWQPQDLTELLAAYSDPETRRWDSDPFDDETGAARWIDVRRAEWGAGSRFSFAIVTDATGATGANGGAGYLVGGIGIKGVEPEKFTAEVGYWVNAAHRGQGVASRALEAVSQWALDLPDGLGLERLDLLHSVDNPPSCAVAEKAGYPLQSVLPPLLPQFPAKGHLHARHAS